MSDTLIGLTGSSGVLGRRISRLLSHRGKTGLVTFRGDLRSESDLRNWVGGHHLDTVILSGAIVPVEKASKFPDETFEVNAFSNLRIAYLMQSRWGHSFRICYISTSHVYLDAEGALGEDSILQPKTVYGRSKLLGERLLQSAAEVFGFELLIARVFSFYSEDQHDSHLYPTLIRRFAKHPNPEAPFELAGWNNIRDFSPADEVAEKVVRLATSGLCGVVNVGSGIGTTVGDFASQIYGSPLRFREEDSSVQLSMLVADTTRFTEWMGRIGL